MGFYVIYYIDFEKKNIRTFTTSFDMSDLNLYVHIILFL